MSIQTIFLVALMHINITWKQLKSADAVYSILFFMIRSLYILSGIEKNNDDCRRIHLNKWDAPVDVLLVSKRIERLSRHQRTPRSYNKRNAEY